MNKKEYAAYEEMAGTFFEREGINCISTMPPNCPECGEELVCCECPEHGTPNTEPYFSWSSCDCCHTSLGGNRQDSWGYHPESKQIFEYTICEDCVYYLEYGRLDDMTMLDIENSEDEDDCSEDTDEA